MEKAKKKNGTNISEDGQVMNFYYVKTHDLDETAVGSRIKCVRLSKGLTTTQMAETLDISEAGLRKLEYGISSPPGKVLFLLHEIYGVDIVWLLFGTRSTHNDILRGLQAENDASKFDIFTRLYSYFITHDNMALVDTYGNAPCTEHFAKHDGIFFRQYMNGEQIDDVTQTIYDSGSQYDINTLSKLDFSDKLKSMTKDELENLLGIISKYMEE